MHLWFTQFHLGRKTTCYQLDHEKGLQKLRDGMLCKEYKVRHITKSTPRFRPPLPEIFIRILQYGSRKGG